MSVRALMIAALTLVAARARADDSSFVRAEAPSKLSFSATIGGTGTPLHVFGGVHDSGRGTGLLQLQVHRTLIQSEGHVFEAVFAVVPVELESGTPVPADPSSPAGPLNRSTVYGAGIDPLGLSMRFGNGPWRPFWNASGGLRGFVDRVPVPLGTHFNFAADIGVGIYRTLTAHYALSLGLDLHHISNGNLGEKNPGVNYLLLTLGIWPTR